jgi:tetratricopeptide (TPR) repeat protein
VRVAALCTALLALAPRAGHAEEKLRPDQIPHKARQLADKGRSYHQAGDYARAIAAFQEAYVLAPSPGLLFNLAQAYRLAGDCDDAAWMYHRYLDTKPATERRTLAENHLATVEKCRHAALQFAITPQPIESSLTGGRPTTRLSHDPTDDDDALAMARREKQAGVAVAIGGGALLAGAAYFALDAYQASGAVSDAYQRGDRGADIKPLEQRGQQSTSYAQWLGIGGGAITAAGLGLYLHGRHIEDSHPVVVAPATRGTGLSVSWQF